MPVIAGTGANSTLEAINLTQSAASIGADYALVVTPYYNKPNQEGLFQHFSKIADSVDIPQILYNVPSRTACDLKPDTVMRLSITLILSGLKRLLMTRKDWQSLFQYLKVKWVKNTFQFSRAMILLSITLCLLVEMV